MKKYIKPHVIYLSWTIMILIFWFIGIPIANIGHSGGEQIPLTLLAYSIGPVIIGYLLISILTTIFFKVWFRKYWLLNVIVFLAASFILISYALSKI